MSKTISQREARQLRKRLAAYEQAEQEYRRAWSQQWPGGVDIARTQWEDGNSTVPVALRTARKLGHAVVAVGDDSGLVRFVALPLPKARV